MNPMLREAGEDDIPEMPDRMVEHDGDGLIILDEGEGEPFDMSEEATAAARASDETEDEE